MRPDIDTYYSMMAMLAASRGTCVRRQVGCVLVDNDHRVMAIGYNGVPRGFTHCIDKACPGAKFKSGEGLDKCQAIHAEQSALLTCHDVGKIWTAYCTTAPCIHCTKLLLNTGCSRIVFTEDYPHAFESRRLWEQAGKEWIHHVIAED